MKSPKITSGQPSTGVHGTFGLSWPRERSISAAKAHEPSASTTIRSCRRMLAPPSGSGSVSALMPESGRAKASAKRAIRPAPSSRAAANAASGMRANATPAVGPIR